MPEQMEFWNDLVKTFGQYLILEDLQAVVEEAFYNAFLAALQGRTREEVLQAAKDEAAKLVTNVSDQMKQQLADLIGRGLEEQLGVDGTARLLLEGLPLDAQRAARLEKFRQSLIADGVQGNELDRLCDAFAERLVAERADVIARTEMARAMEEGNLANAANRGATHKVWIAVGDGKVCEECEAAQAEGPIPIDQDFTSGAGHAPCHPNCRCTVSFVTDTGHGELDRAKEDQADLAAALDAIRAESKGQE